MNKLYPEYYSSGVLPLGNPADVGDVTSIYDTSKGERILGIKYKSLEEVTQDLMGDFKQRGWLDKKYEPTAN